jgi:NitT/TauT family transport system ATP-binding protein
MKLQCRNLSKTFHGAGEPVPALRNLDLHVADGEIVSLVGPSGCGKSTLLRIIAGLIPPDTGEVQRPPGCGRAPTALVFQEHGLFPWLTVLDNVAFGLRTAGGGRVESRRRAERLLA